MKVVLLAAGKGERLYPITNEIPKQMIKIGGKPILEYILEKLISLNFNDICIVVGHNGVKIKQYFKDGARFGIKISYVFQQEQNGTANATYLAKDFVGNNPFLLYLADTIIPNDLEHFLQNVTFDNSDVTLLSSKISPNQTKSVGNILVNDGIVKEISEKSQIEGTKFGWAGLAFFKSHLIFKTIENLHLSRTKEFEITEAIGNMLRDGKIIKNFQCSSFIDTGTLNGLCNLMKFLLKDNYETLSTQIINPVYVGKNCKFGKNTKIGPQVSVGDNISIGENTILKNSIILDDTNILPNQKISYSILSPNHKISLEN